ncbi:Cell surface mannoprotein MP65 [Spathaspora sp. JA1]|nr:Cell surface mannoprotein MP65 [Spathaspora sp. JA1]
MIGRLTLYTSYRPIQLLRFNRNLATITKFDTKHFVQILQDKGDFSQKQAEIAAQVVNSAINDGISSITNNLVSKETLSSNAYQQKVDFAKLKGELQTMDKAEFTSLKKEQEKLRTDLTNLKNRLKEEITKNQAGVRLDLNLEKGRIREESSIHESKIEETYTRIDEEIANMQMQIKSVKTQVMQWLIGNLSTSPLSLQGAIATSITAFRKTIKEYSDLLDKNVNDPSYAKHDSRLQKFNRDLSEFHSKFESLKFSRDSIVQENNKQELLGRRHTHNTTTSSDNPYDPTNQQQQSYMSYQEGLYKEKDTLSRGTEQLDHILEMGQQAFEDIVDQNEVLRKLQTKFEESLVVLGVSRGTIRIMNLSYLVLYLLVANLAKSAPIHKRWDFFDLFEDPETTSVIAASPTTTQAIIPNISPAPAAVDTPAKVFQLAVTPSVAPQTTTSSRGSFFGNFQGVIDAFFGSKSTTNQAIPAAIISTPPPVVGPATSVQAQPQAITTDLGFGFGGETTITTIVTVTSVGYPSNTQALRTSDPDQAPQQTTSSSTYGSFFQAFLDFFSPSSPSSSSNQPAVLPTTSETTASILVPSLSTAIPASQVSNTPSPVTTLGISFQGGSPGLYTGTANMATATAVNGGSSAGANAAVGAMGITYSPYTKSNQCKSASDVAGDIAKLSNYDVIRLYSTDCSGIENVLSAMGSNQKLFLGVWNVNSVQGELQDIVNAISGSSQGWGVVHTIAIGNEQVNSGAATVQDIQNAVAQSRAFLKTNAPGYTGPIVSVDTLVAVAGNPALCEVSDYLAVNSHPYWDGGVQPGNSGPWLLQQIAHLQSVCGTDKQVLITETGWPTQGDTYGQCVPSVPNQVSALKSIVSSLGSQAIVFTMYNDYWKDPGPYNVEQHWGIFGDPAE